MEEEVVDQNNGVRSLQTSMVDDAVGVVTATVFNLDDNGGAMLRNLGMEQVHQYRLITRSCLDRIIRLYWVFRKRGGGEADFW